jgi:hypothetical protein
MSRTVLGREQGLLPIRDADDLHEVDLDAEIRDRLPEPPSGAHRA